MKKFAKYVLLTGCIALFIFLLLPFLEPPSLPQSTAQEAQKASSPQIFTSNPLTELVGKIARFFTGKSKNQPNAAATNQLAQGGTNLAFSNNPVDSALYAAGYEGTPTQTPAPEAEPGQDPDAANAAYFMENEEGEWVLIRQRSPESAQEGIHEISVKEDPYDRYVKQERLARFSPTMRPSKTEEVPESKLASLFKPIKSFFGIEDKAAASGSLQAGGTALASARQTGRTSGLDPNRSKQAQQFSRAQDVNVAMGKLNYSTNDFNGPISLNDVLRPARSTREAAEDVANSMFPREGGNSSQQGGAAPSANWQQAAQQKEDEYNHLRDEKILKELLRLSNGKEATDAIPETLNCDKSMVEGIVTLTAENNSSSCHIPELEELETIKAQNLERFDEITQMGKQIDLNVTPVLGVVDPDSLSKLKEPVDASKDWAFDPNLEQKEKEKYLDAKATYDMYAFMLEKAKDQCAGQPCFWAMVNSPDSKIAQIVDAGGGSLSGDADKAWETYKKEYVDWKLSQMENPTKKEKKEIEQTTKRAKNMWTIVAGEDIKNWKGTPYFTNPPAGKVFHTTYGFDKRSLVSTDQQGGNSFVDEKDGKYSIADQSRDFVEGAGNSINMWREGNRAVEQAATQDSVENMIQPKVKQAQEELKNNIESFKKGLEQSTK